MAAVFKQKEDFIEKDVRGFSFAQIIMDVIHDPNLDGGIGIFFIRLLSMPSDWKISTRQLAKSFRLNLETVKKYINKLIALGYIVRVQIKQKNRFRGFKLYVRNKLNNIIGLQNTESEKSTAGDPPTTNIDLTKKEQDTNKLGSTNTCARDSTVSTLPQQPGGRGLFKKSWREGNNATGGYRMNKGPKDFRTVLGDVSKKAAEQSELNLSSEVPSTPEALSALIGDKVSIACLKVWIHKYGLPAVQRHVLALAEKLKTQNIDVNSVFSPSVPPQCHPEPKTSRTQEKQPSMASYSPTGHSNPVRDPKNNSSAPVGDSNDYESVKRECTWTMDENRAFYERSSRQTREMILSGIREKWPAIDFHCQQYKIDPLSDGFTHSHVFPAVSDILNECRLQTIWSSIRSR